MTKKDTERLQSLRKRVASASTGPGIYRWLDEKGMVLYVGKAKNLRKRLASYLVPKKGNGGPWREAFLSTIADFDVTVTSSELEALLLETNLIKQLKPKYNVLMKDDKNYLFIRVSVQDPYPRVETIRRFEQDGAKFFGPYLNSEEAYQTLEMLQVALGYRACKQSLEILNHPKKFKKIREAAGLVGPDAERPSEGRVGPWEGHRRWPSHELKPCLEHQIGRCNGLCAGAISTVDYLKRIEEVIAFLNGQKENVKKILTEQMKTAAAERKFETAAKIRNYLSIIDGKSEKQVVTDGTGEDSDIVGVAILSNRAHVVVMHRRDGRLLGESHFALSGQAESASSVLEQFLPQFYDDGREIPVTIFIPESPPEGSGIMEKLLRERRKGPVKLIVPERGRKSRLLQLAERNAREKARQMEMKWEAEQRNTVTALEQLEEILSLPSAPKRIEGYDISHLCGTETVGSMVVMKDGKAANDLYRSFTIRTMKSGQVDDYKAIKEVLTRRMRRLTEDVPAEEKKWNEGGIAFGKALKKEQAAIEKIHAEHPSEMSDVGIDYKNYLVAREQSDIVGFGRLVKHPQGIVELKSIWVNESLRGGRLGQFIARKILRSVKKGKVYVTIVPELEQYYAHIGFRYVITPPKVLMDEMDEEKRKFPETPMGIVMMWEAHQNKIDPSLTAKPDLIVIDGGKGQLSTAVDVLKSFHVEIPVIGLAKREEEIFVPGKSHPIPFPSDSPAKFLLMRLRDEAHRFSNAHREKRAKHTMKASQLDEIPGLGEETKKMLLAKFGSISAIKNAGDEQLLEIISNAQLNSLRGM